jgi:hypothetical protein
MTHFVILVPIGLVYSVCDTREVAISKMVEARQRRIMMMSSQGEVGGIDNPDIKRKRRVTN